MKRSGSVNLRNLSKLRHVSRLLHYWLARRLARTVPAASQSVHSCLPYSAHPPSTTLCQNRQLRVNDTSLIGDQVLCIRMLTITYHKRTLSDFFSLTLQLILTQWISVEIQHAPPCVSRRKR